MGFGCYEHAESDAGFPGAELQADVPDGFALRGAFVDYLREYAYRFSLPVVDHAQVDAVDQAPAGGFIVRSKRGEYTCNAVIVASGAMSQAKVPEMADRFPDSVVQFTAASYRRPDALPAGATVVVGSGQSGVQIVEDLLEAGRKVYLCTSRVGRTARRYRGKDITWWGRETGGLDMMRKDVKDPAVFSAAQPQGSGTRAGHTVSLQQLHRDGCKLLGKLSDVQGGVLLIEPNLLDNMAFADTASAGNKTRTDGYIEKTGGDHPPVEPDPAEAPVDDLGGADQVISLDMAQAGIGSVIWATGFVGDFSWLNVPAVDPSGNPVHELGISPHDGVYFLGFPWLSKRKSGIVFGVAEDASRIVDHIAAKAE